MAETKSIRVRAAVLAMPAGEPVPVVRLVDPDDGSELLMVDASQADELAHWIQQAAIDARASAATVKAYDGEATALLHTPIGGRA